MSGLNRKPAGHDKVKQILGTLVLIPVERLLNHLIARDQYVLRKLQPFCDKILEINSTTPIASLLIRFHADRVRLSALDATSLHLQPDARVTGSTGDLVSLLINTAQRPLANPQVSITGDALFVQDLFHVLRDMDIDWRDYLAPFLGDVATREAGQLGKQARQWGSQAHHNLRRSLDEYVKEERRLVPAGTEIESFNDDLDQLKLAIDRIEARARTLLSRLDKSLKNQHLST